MTRMRDGLRAMTLRRRLVAVLLVLLLFSCALVAAVTAYALRHFLVQRLDQQVVAASQRYSSTNTPTLGDNRFDRVNGQAPGTFVAQVVDGHVTATRLVIGGHTRRPSEEDITAVTDLGVTKNPRSIDLPDLGEYRIYVTGTVGDRLITGLPTDEVDDTIARLWLIEGVVFAFALTVTGVAGAVLVRLSLRPLTSMAGTARRVSQLPLSSGEVALSERVPNPTPGTEVGQVSGAFNHMLEHIEAALGARQGSQDRLRHFVADASHELRTPIAVIRSHAEFARRAGGELPETVASALLRIGSESERMGHLVEDLLLLARLDTGRPLDRTSVDLTRLAIDAVTDAQVAGPDHQWRLELPDEPVVVSGDEHALHQVVANLLSNARTHTPPGTTVVTEVLHSPGSVQLRVRDDGPGIPAAVLPNIFERFVRADDARSRSTGSTGLGLSIVAAIVSAHGATVDVVSRPGLTDFVVCF
jgi:two-component system OmpR family sensor kinase